MSTFSLVLVLRLVSLASSEDAFECIPPVLSVDAQESRRLWSAEQYLHTIPDFGMSSAWGDRRRCKKIVDLLHIELDVPLHEVCKNMRYVFKHRTAITSFYDRYTFSAQEIAAIDGSFLYTSIAEVLVMYHRKGDEGLRYYAKAFAILKLIFEPKQAIYMELYNGLGNLYSQQGSYDKALTCYKKALRVLHQKGVTHVFDAPVQYNIADMHRVNSEPFKAAWHYYKAAEGFSKKGSKTDSRYHQSLYMLRVMMLQISFCFTVLGYLAATFWPVMRLFPQT